MASGGHDLQGDDRSGAHVCRAGKGVLGSGVGGWAQDCPFLGEFALEGLLATPFEGIGVDGRTADGVNGQGARVDLRPVRRRSGFGDNATEVFPRESRGCRSASARARARFFNTRPKGGDVSATTAPRTR